MSAPMRNLVTIGVPSLLFGAVLIAAYWLIPDTSPDYGRRWLILLFGVMLVVVGFQFVRQSLRGALPPRLGDVLDGVAQVVVFGTFGAIFSSGAVRYGAEIRGSLGWLSPSIDNVVGRIVFGVSGGVMLLLAGIALIRVLWLIVPRRHRA